LLKVQIEHRLRVASQNGKVAQHVANSTVAKAGGLFRLIDQMVYRSGLSGVAAKHAQDAT
jgi:hypothetical protein